MKYLLDTNVFIQANNLHYGLDFCPAFWEWLLINQQTIVGSLDKVKDEILAGDDALVDWVKQKNNQLFYNFDQKSLGELIGINNTLRQLNYEAHAISSFKADADYFLIAYARSHNLTIVTHEIPSDSPKKVKIPNICTTLGVQYMQPFQMLRIENVKFVLFNQV